jgi:hypothetical protein
VIYSRCNIIKNALDEKCVFCSDVFFPASDFYEAAGAEITNLTDDENAVSVEVKKKLRNRRKKMQAS